MDNWETNPGKIPTPSADPIDAHEKVYEAIRAAISASDFRQAHSLLQPLIETDGKNPELWLLLSWTASDSQAAENFFKELLNRQPDYPLAKCGVPWSGKEWSPQAEDQTGSRMLARLSAMPGLKDGPPASEDKVDPAAPEPVKEMLFPDTNPAWYKISPAPWGIQSQSPLPDWSESLRAEEGDQPTGVNADQPQSNLTTKTDPPAVKPEIWPEWTGNSKDHPPVNPPAIWPEANPQARTNPDLHAPSVWPEASAAPKDNQPHPRNAEWFEPAAWAVNTGTATGPLLDRRRSGSSRQETRLSETVQRIGYPLFLLLYFLGIASAELVTLMISPQAGSIVHALLLGMILVHALLEAKSGKHIFLLALGLVPLTRLLSILTALPQIDLIPRYLVIGIPLLLSCLAVYRWSGYKPRQVGLAWGKWLPVQLAVGLAGIGLGYLEYLILKPQPLVEGLNLGSLWPVAFVLFVFPGFVEELIFRGLLQRASTGSLNKFGPWYVAALFALLHLNTKSWLAVALAAGVGIGFSFIAARTRSLFGVTLGHGLANISLFLVFPFLLAGPLQDPAQLSPMTIHGNGPPIWSAPLSRAGAVPDLPSTTATSSFTPLPLTSTVTATPSATPSATRTITLTPYWTLTATATGTPTPTSTTSPTPTNTAIRTATRTSTRTVAPPPLTYTPTLPPTITNTPVPTVTLTLVPTETPTSTVDMPIEHTPTP